MDVNLCARFANTRLVQGEERATGTFFEPMLSLGGGQLYFRLQAQAGLSFGLEKKPVYFDHQPFIFSFGLILKVDGLFDGLFKSVSRST